MKKLTTKLTLVVIMVLVFTLSLVMMVACDINTPDTHNHSYSEDWKSDKDNHWKECSCGDKSELGAHASNDGDEICDTCGYNMHIHSYSDTWKSDGTNHWKECSCGDKSESAAHIDEKDANGNVGHDEKCDICGYDMHKHNYIYGSDENGHWNLCLGCEDKGATEAHVDADNDGACDICTYRMYYKVTVKDDKGNAVKDVEIEIGEETATTDENGVAKFYQTLPDEEYIIFNSYPDGYYKDDYYLTSAGTYAYEIVLITEVTNTFELYDYKNSTNMSGKVVKLMDGTTVVAQGTTDSDGLVTLTYRVGKEGKYYFAVDGLTDDQYLTDGAGIAKYAVSDTPTSINVYTYAKYTITIECAEGVEHSLEGLTVELYKTVFGSSTLLASAQTNASGVAVLKTTGSSNTYTVKVKGLNDGYSIKDGSVGLIGTSFVDSATLTIEKESEGGGEEGGSGSTTDGVLSLGTNTITGSLDTFYEPCTPYTFTATEDGSYAIGSTDPNCLFTYNGKYYFDVCYVTLEADETITIYFGTNSSYDNTNTYDVDVKSVTPIPSGFVGQWVCGEDISWTITSFTITDAEYLDHSLDKITIVSSKEIKVGKYTLTYMPMMNQIQVSGEGITTYNLSVYIPSLYTDWNYVDANAEGVEYSFTASEDGTYIISTASDNAYIVSPSDLFDPIEGKGSVEIVLEKDQTIFIFFATMDETESAYVVTISKLYTPIEIGTTSITANANGVKYTFTATEAGTYTISCSSANCWITEADYAFDSIVEGGSSTITLEAGGRFTLCCYTYDDSEDTYDVVISLSTTGGDEGGSGEGEGSGEEGDGDGETTITFPSEAIGTWYSVDGDIIVISANGVSMNGNACSSYATREVEGVTYYQFSSLTSNHAIYSSNNTWYFGTYAQGNLYADVLLTEMPTA